MKIVPLAVLTGRGGVLVHGTFDLLHIGHVRMMKAAAALGAPLVVTLTAGRYIRKGPGRPVFTDAERLEWVEALECVDWVALADEPSGVSVIETVRPRFYVKGRDTLQWTNVIAVETQACERVGAEIRYIDTGVVYHSGELLSGKYLREAAA